MLYVTTRNNLETYTAHRALTESKAPDGGFYIPLRMPQFDQAQIQSLSKRPFNQCVADILNLLFSTHLTAFDVDFSIGRCAVHLVPLSHRILLGETWHNLEWNFDRMVHNLYQKVSGEENGKPSDWFRIAVQIGVLFGFFGKLMRKELAGVHSPVDVAVLSGDFTAPMAAWYARSWGLPIANIVICCNDNNNSWELLHHGQMRTNQVAVRTCTPEGDYVVPADLERFVYECGGFREANRFAEICREGRMYVPSDFVLENMQQGMYAAVIGEARVLSAIPNVYRTHQQVMEPYTALIYSGLLDYRAGTGASRTALVLSNKGPVQGSEIIAAAMGISENDLLKILNIT